MAATSAAIRMKKPADAACAPLGPTQTMTGVLAPSMAVKISRVEVRRPPGVSSSRTTAAAPAASASASPSRTYSAAIGWMIERTRR
jgi:hypothetical protein